MSERIKEFTRRDLDGNRIAVVINARYVVTVEDRYGGGAVITVLGSGMTYQVTQSRAEVCAWLRDDA